MGHIMTQKYITRSDLRNNPNVAYLFGDNDRRTGMGGQAKEMRGEPNAFGIRTKKDPYTYDSVYYTDNELQENCNKIASDFEKAISFVEEKPESRAVIVIPEDGLGTGLADLKNKAPLTFQFLQYITQYCLAYDLEEMRSLGAEFSQFCRENKINIDSIF